MTLKDLEPPKKGY